MLSVFTTHVPGSPGNCYLDPKMETVFGGKFPPFPSERVWRRLGFYFHLRAEVILPRGGWAVGGQWGATFVCSLHSTTLTPSTALQPITVPAIPHLTCRRDRQPLFHRPQNGHREVTRQRLVPGSLEPGFCTLHPTSPLLSQGHLGGGAVWL